MFYKQNFIIGVVPSIIDEAKFCSLVSREFKSIAFNDYSLFLPLSPVFEMTQRSVPYFVRELEDRISFLHTTLLNWGTIISSAKSGCTIVVPIPNQLIHTLSKYIRDTLIDSRYVSTIHETIGESGLKILIPQNRTTNSDVELFLDFSWKVESISFLALENNRWQEKFFLPLSEQRKERTKSHAILPCI